MLVATGALCASAIEIGDSASLSYNAAHRADVVNSVNVFTPGGVTASPDSVRLLIDQFYVNQFRHFQDPDAPFFMLMSKEATLAMGIGGKIKLVSWYDWNGSVKSNDFHPYQIPVPKNPSSRRNLGATPSGSSLFLTILGRNHRFGRFMAYLEAGFSGYHDIDFKLKQAYVTFNDWTIGLAKSTFSDPSAQAPGIDGAGSNGKLDHDAPLVRWMHTFRDNWTLAASVEIPSFGIEARPDTTAKNNSYVPDVSTFLQYSWGESHVRLAGLARVLTYRDLLASHNYSTLGWGVQLSAAIQVGKPLTLFGSLNVGKGISSYSNDLAVDDYDLMNDLDNPGRMYMPLAWSLAIGAQYYWTPSVFSALTLSEARFMSDKRMRPDDFKYGLYGAASIFWNMTSRMCIGAEYIIGKRQNFSHAHACGDRINALFLFNF